MATVIKTARDATLVERIPRRLAEILPYRLSDEIRRVAEEPIEEIRLRADRCATLTLAGRNLRLQTVLRAEELSELVVRFCDGSLYAHRDHLAQGFLSLPEGIRVGVCGRAAVETGKVVGVYDISALNIRLPARTCRYGAEICKLLQKGKGSVLIYAPPGEGKTTLLRGVAARMSSGERPWRVVVIDTRGELGGFLGESALCLDILAGYPRALGIEIATRTMNAQLILCDEIGEPAEAEAILSAQNCGVPFVATAHGDDVDGLLRRTGIRRLHEARVFAYYVGLRRPATGGEFEYRITEWEVADERIQSIGSHSACR